MTYGDRQALAALLFLLALVVAVWGLFVGQWLALVVTVLFFCSGLIEESC